MKIRLNVSIGLFILSTFLFSAIAFAATYFTQMGFPKLIAEKFIKAGQAAKISYGEIKIHIPEGAFTNDVTSY